MKFHIKTLISFICDTSFLDQRNSDEFQTLINSPDFQKYRDQLYDYQEAECQRSEMWRFWNGFLSMVDNILSIPCATRAGHWILYIELIHGFLPWAFACDRQNYARYLTLHLMEMVNVEENHRCIYDDFMEGNFSVQMPDNNTFGRLEADKLIETTINKDTKTLGGTTGMI